MVVGNPIDPLHFVEKCAFVVDQVDVHRHESVRMRGATEAEMIRPHKRRDSIPRLTMPSRNLLPSIGRFPL
jgi:hypothetical protein